MVSKKAYDRARYLQIRNERRALRPPDCLTQIDKIDLAYMAGIVDGEGSIFIAAVGPKRHKTVYPIVCVAMTDKLIIDWLRSQWDCGAVQIHNQTNLRKSPHLRTQYRVTLFGKRASLLCCLLLPFLRVKKEQAALVTTFPCDARIAPGQKIERTEINEIRYSLRDEINSLNHMPRNKNCRRHKLLEPALVG